MARLEGAPPSTVRLWQDKVKDGSDPPPLSCEADLLSLEVAELSRVFMRQVGDRASWFDPKGAWEGGAAPIILTLAELAKIGWIPNRGPRNSPCIVGDHVIAKGELVGRTDLYQYEDPENGLYCYQMEGVPPEQRLGFISHFCSPGHLVVSKMELTRLFEYAPAKASYLDLFELVPEGGKVGYYNVYAAEKDLGLGFFYKLDLGKHREAGAMLRSEITGRLKRLRAWLRREEARFAFKVQFCEMMTGGAPSAAMPPSRLQAEQEWAAKFIADKDKWVVARQLELEELARAAAEDEQAERDEALLRAIQERQARRAARAAASSAQSPGTTAPGTAPD